MGSSMGGERGSGGAAKQAIRGESATCLTQTRKKVDEDLHVLMNTVNVCVCVCVSQFGEMHRHFP